MSADFYHPFLVGIEECAEEAGYDLLLFTSARATRGKRRIFNEDSRVRPADGRVPLGRTVDRDDLARLIADQIPFVVDLLIPREVTIVPLFQVFNRAGLINTHGPPIVVPILGAPSVPAPFIMRQSYLRLPGNWRRPPGWTAWATSAPSTGSRSRWPDRRSAPSPASPSCTPRTSTWSRSCACPAPTCSRSRRRSPSSSTPTAGPCGTSSSPPPPMTAVPILIVFVLAQRQFIEGLAHTGLKE